MRKPGCVEPVIFFRRADGHLVLAPYTENVPTPEGYVKESVDTLPQIRILEATLQRQELEELRRTGEREAAAYSAAHARINSNLYQRMISADSTEFEKEFIRLWLKMRADHPKRKYYEEQFNTYLWCLHHDSGKRPVDKEVVINVDVKG